MKESLKELFIKLNLDGFAPYLDNTAYLIFFFVILTFILFYLISFVLKLSLVSKIKNASSIE